MSASSIGYIIIACAILWFIACQIIRAVVQGRAHLSTPAANWFLAAGFYGFVIGNGIALAFVLYDMFKRN